MTSIRSDIIHIENERLLNLMSIFLNDSPNAVTPEDINALREFGISDEEAFALTLAGLFDLDIVENTNDRRFYECYFPFMFHKFSQEQFANNPYLTNIDFPSKEVGNSKFEIKSYEPYEAFVCDDFIINREGRILPQIGFFEDEYFFPTVTEGGRIWMSVTPQEILTIEPAVKRAHGKVLTYGLGLGYFAYMAAIKPEVTSVTVVDCNPDIISIFEEHVLPQFGRVRRSGDAGGGVGNEAGGGVGNSTDSLDLDCAGKITIVDSDAFDYAEHLMQKEQFDFVYGDIWHDVGDGFDLYQRMKSYEHKLPNAEFMYWIEPTIKCYM